MWPTEPAVSCKTPDVVASDVRDDVAQELVLQYLHSMANARREVMFVISQLYFGNYLNKWKEYYETSSSLPRPDTIPGDKNDRRGDFDILIVHSQYGIIVGEVKSVGGNTAALKQSEQDLHKAIADKVQRGVKQLNKAHRMLKHLVSDLPTPVNITKALMLPNLTSEQTLCALRANPSVEKELCQSLDTDDLTVAVGRCLCSDHLSNLQLNDSSDDGPASENRSPNDWSWWRQAVLEHGHDENMTPHLYKRLIARFCGPATTIDVPTVTPPRHELRSESQGIAHTGLIMARLTLYPYQVRHVTSRKRLVFLSGPPGTGKTIVLAVKALKWMEKGKDVHLLSTHDDARAVSYLMQKQLESTLDKDSTVRVYRHAYDFIKNHTDVDVAVKELTAAAAEKGGELFVIADEAVNYGFEDFCQKLLTAVPDLHLWAASVQQNIRPECFTHKKLTVSLRCPPVVEKEVSRSDEVGKSVSAYEKSLSPRPTDGPPVKWLNHKGQPGHKGGPAERCEQCGKDIAHILKGLIQPGVSDLEYRDVLVVCSDPTDEKQMIVGLRSSGIPVRVVPAGANEDDVRRLALAEKNEVVVTVYTVVSGLERRILVGVGDNKFGNNGLDRLYSMSRCTSQLVWIGKQ
nr:hypothetical protein BaRGS_025850 [Batillaria attramentaria]